MPQNGAACTPSVAFKPPVISSEALEVVPVSPTRNTAASRLRLPPVVFLGHRATQPVPNNFPVTRLQASRDPMVRIEHKYQSALGRRAFVARHLCKGSSGVQTMIQHSQNPDGVLANSDAESTLHNPHIGIHSNRRKKKGIDFTDATLFGTTVLGGTLLGVTMHQHEDLMRMRELDIVDLDPFTTGDQKVHESVASTSGTKKATRIEDVLMERGFRDFQLLAEESRISVCDKNETRAKGANRQSVEPLNPPRHTPPLVSSVLQRANDTELETDELSATRNRLVAPHDAKAVGGDHAERKLFSMTIAKRLKDKDINFVPSNHAPVLPTGVEAKEVAKALRNRRRFSPPREVADEFYDAVRGDRNVARPVPLSVELAFEQKRDDRSTVGGSVQILIDEIFSLAKDAKAARKPQRSAISGTSTFDVFSGAQCILRNHQPSGATPSTGLTATTATTATALSRAHPLLDL